MLTFHPNPPPTPQVTPWFAAPGMLIPVPSADLPENAPCAETTFSTLRKMVVSFIVAPPDPLES